MKKRLLVNIILSLVGLFLLVLPVAAANTYIVKYGDTLYEIGQKFGVAYQEIAKVNNIKDPNVIFAEQTLIIPEANNISDSPETPETLLIPGVNYFPDYSSEVSDGFKVTIIGSGMPILSIDRGGPSILVQYKNKYFLVDCGPGTSHGLIRSGIRPEQITNLLITHHHYDHNADYWTFSIGGWQTPEPAGRRLLNLVGPVGTKLMHEATISVYQKDIDYRTSVIGIPTDGIITNVNIIELTDETHAFELDNINITALAVPHTIETYAYKFEADGQSVVISGDLTYTDKFAPFAKGADILVMDGMLAETTPPAPTQMRQALNVSHLTNADIAKIAAEANPKKLVLVHLGASLNIEYNVNKYRAAGYKGEVIEGKDGLVILP